MINPLRRYAKPRTATEARIINVVRKIRGLPTRRVWYTRHGNSYVQVWPK